MTNELLVSQSTELSMWDDNKKLAEIKKVFAPDLTELEFSFFVGIGKATNLNPFLREIWSVKYPPGKDGKQKPAQVFIGRDGYRKAAQGHSEYDYHQSDAVYENDIFEVVDGNIRHSYTLKNRGTLIGAYCIAKRHKSSRPMYVFAALDEYSTGQSLWKEPSKRVDNYGNTTSVGGKPATMIKKVAESQCLRACFQDLLGGTYGEEEFDNSENENQQKITNKATNVVNNLLEKKGFTYDSKPIESTGKHNTQEQDKSNTAQTEQNNESEEMGEIRRQKISADNKIDETPITDELLDEISGLLHEKPMSGERMEKALNYLVVNSIEEMNVTQAKRFIKIINAPSKD